MAIGDLLDDLDGEIASINSSGFSIEVTKTNFVPNDSDPNLTFENFDNKTKKVKVIETCVLYVDIRKSTNLNLQHYPKTMAKLYSSFIRGMIKAAEYYNGKIRNIIGDRVMVVFNSSNCFVEAVNTAILMNTICKKIINVRFKNNEFSCGIGIDFGKMMVTKCGTIKQGAENSSYKSLVWLGRPANIASKLTDIANKEATSRYVSGVEVGLYYPNIDEWSWLFYTPKELEESIKFTYSPTMIFKNQHFNTFFATGRTYSNNDASRPILVSDSVYKGFKNDAPNAPSIVNKWWKKENRRITGYSGIIHGADLTFSWK